ncbi:MAG: hypothetical protein ABI992_13735, partial [Chthoniobacterales bacterium]
MSEPTLPVEITDTTAATGARDAISRLAGNPYAGPRALGANDQIFGRTREINALIDLLIAERIVLLYSPAGAGKTSLIEAHQGLRERLRVDEGFRVLPSIRVGSPGPDGVNRFLFSAMRSLENETSDPAALAGMNFSDYLTRREAAPT